MPQQKNRLENLPTTRPPTRASCAGVTLLLLGAAPGLAAAQDVTLPPVTVKGKSQDDTPQNLKTNVSGGALGTRSQLETPFSSTVVTREELEQRQVSKLGDVFALDASVSDNRASSTT